MSKINKIALLIGADCRFSYEIEEFQDILKEYNIESRVFYESESILEYKPCCVIVTSPSDAKLTPYPTFGVLNLDRASFLQLPRYIRNALTYDGYLIQSPIMAQTLGDIMFGARKIGSQTISMNFYPMKSKCREVNIAPRECKVLIFEPNYEISIYKRVIKSLLKNCNNAYLVTRECDTTSLPGNKVIKFDSYKSLPEIFDEKSIAVCLDAGTDGNISTSLMKCISLSVPVITRESEILQREFEGLLSYIPNTASVSAVPKLVDLMAAQLISNPEKTNNNVRMAIDVFNEKYALNVSVPKFITMYNKTLIDKGYLPKPDPIFEAALPSVTYIMRTGGKHRPFLERALDCLVAQQYPDLRVIFVTHVKVPFLNEIIDQYSSIKFKVLESIKSKRSQAIRDGMAAVETELFGLFDDDDELFPNHVRSLVYTLMHHNRRDWRGEIGMVYSASIHADDTYPVPERAEFRDYKLVGKGEKRAIEHYRYYNSTMMSQHAWFMPNGWLARTSLLDDEILQDPGLDTCEDLYFELQIAQKAHFAFSGEVTAIHHFHHFGNSTIDDSHKHLPDTQRIALRNFARTFPADSNYDIADKFWLIGKQFSGQEWIRFADKVPNPEVDYTVNQFYPARMHKPVSHVVTVTNANVQGRLVGVRLKSIIKTGLIPFKLMKYSVKFATLQSSRRTEYMNKFLRSIEEQGLIKTILKIHTLIEHGQVAEFVHGSKHSIFYLGLRKFLTIFRARSFKKV